MATREAARKAAAAAQQARKEAAEAGVAEAATEQARPAKLGPVTTSDLSWEYLVSPGRVILEMDMVFGGGVLQVTAHTTSHQHLPEDAEPGSELEWRVLRFVSSATHFASFVQSVVKVCHQPDFPERPVRMLTSILALPYTRSLVSVTLAALASLGAPVLPGPAKDPLRVLVVGLGGGSVPSWLAGQLPHCKVDVAELEPAVSEAAEEAMGCASSSRMRISLEDGGVFALQAAATTGGCGGAYDAVLVDAIDINGVLPSSLQTPKVGLCLALERGLLHGDRGLIVTNLIPGPGSRTPGTILAAHAQALAARCSAGTGFSVRAEGVAGNFIAVQTSSARQQLPRDVAGLQSQLEAGARHAASAARGCDFDMVTLATRQLRVW